MKKVSGFVLRSLAALLVPAWAWAGPVNINTADAKTLARELDGIGPAKAQAIVDYRQKNGTFKTANDLLKVEGIGAKVLEQNRDNIRVEKGGGESSDGKKGAAKTAASAKPAVASAEPAEGAEPAEPAEGGKGGKGGKDEPAASTAAGHGKVTGSAKVVRRPGDQPATDRGKATTKVGADAE